MRQRDSAALNLLLFILFPETVPSKLTSNMCILVYRSRICRQCGQIDKQEARARKLRSVQPSGSVCFCSLCSRSLRLRTFIRTPRTLTTAPSASSFITPRPLPSLQSPFYLSRSFALHPSRVCRWQSIVPPARSLFGPLPSAKPVAHASMQLKIILN